jgi:hypothetical protein
VWIVFELFEAVFANGVVVGADEIGDVFAPVVVLSADAALVAAAGLRLSSFSALHRCVIIQIKERSVLPGCQDAFVIISIRFSSGFGMPVRLLLFANGRTNEGSAIMLLFW